MYILLHIEFAAILYDQQKVGSGHGIGAYVIQPRKAAAWSKDLLRSPDTANKNVGQRIPLPVWY